MNRIEQVAVPTPAQQPQPRLPRALADVLRRAARAVFPPGEPAGRARRGTSGIAVAIAAFAVPLLPGSAFGVATATGAGAAGPEAPHAWQHLHHGEVYPGPDRMTVQAWSASGWTLTVPLRPGDSAEIGLPGDRVLTTHDGRYVPWISGPEPAPIGAIPGSRPVVLPDGKRGEIAAYRVSHTSPRAVRVARNRFVPTPMVTGRSPGTTKQMMVGAPVESPCSSVAPLPGQDSRMLAHLRPAVDDMNVVAAHPRMVCAAKVNYLSQARA